MTLIMQLRKQIQYTISNDDRHAYALILIWLLAMVSLPIATWVIGESAIPIGINIAAILQGSAVFYMVQQQWGLRATIRALLIVMSITWTAEFIGHRTGFPFGSYHYTEVLQPQLGGVPLLIPVAWFMLLPSSWVMAQLIVGEQRKTWQTKAAFVITSALALTAWDLFLDPQMVGWNFWQWDTEGIYFGIPLSNYAGWLLASSLVTLAVNPRPLKVMPLALVYGIVWFLQSFGQAFFWGQAGPAFFGMVGMGSIMLAAYLRNRN